MKISIITLFPEVFEPILNSSILKRAQKKGLVEFELINLRDFGEGKHQIVDGRPYGGGAGMVLKADVLAKAVKQVYSKQLTVNRKRSLSTENCKLKTILTSASGNPYKQNKAKELSKLDHITIVCGHYEGVDQRFIDKYVSEEISIGDYVLTGGEIPAMVITDSITRLIPGVLEKPEAIQNESFSTPLLEHPQYTRPDEFKGEKVPEVLISGNHAQINKWRCQKSLEKTKKIRPDLLTQKD
ncbi:tRNA (guanosine(37)-N1)-methyltransferase TrmD [Candidatus Daviesbacteria bacterium RIFCSPLOWO2_02_FULL_36_7]|uniref:tRNA (guanine-N(1)-)-methyltransferase n=1 Tax=Candidatus Daviesbacteria bacterium RIFCSPLOWO2_02_FULL_36_7 TaxID=1797792 RepID=A0A1F5MG47_9BACT|nr:MAG: tRNA (guanosine(37)-N1)-methyltransferase TrmD [Candidatus Daviesbacteria bacterium RIFCSPLOWO2_02_FULL_36_7]